MRGREPPSALIRVFLQPYRVLYIFFRTKGPAPGEEKGTPEGERPPERTHAGHPPVPRFPPPQKKKNPKPPFLPHYLAGKGSGEDGAKRYFKGHNLMRKKARFSAKMAPALRSASPPRGPMPKLGENIRRRRPPRGLLATHPKKPVTSAVVAPRGRGGGPPLSVPPPRSCGGWMMAALGLSP